MDPLALHSCFLTRCSYLHMRISPHRSWSCSSCWDNGSPISGSQSWIKSKRVAEILNDMAIRDPLCRSCSFHSSSTSFHSCRWRTRCLLCFSPKNCFSRQNSSVQGSSSCAWARGHSDPLFRSFAQLLHFISQWFAPLFWWAQAFSS